MDVYGYITVSTDASKTTAQNGVDICESSACSGGTPSIEDEIVLESLPNKTLQKIFTF